MIFLFADFLRAHLGEKTGDLVEFETGKKVGEHKGFWFYTIGQRQGIKLSGGPWYVVSKDCQKNIIFISRHYTIVDQAKNGMIVERMNWISGIPSEKSDLEVKFRHGPQLHAVYVENKNGMFYITLKEKSKQGISIGQFAVLYDGYICLGGSPTNKVF